MKELLKQIEDLDGNILRGEKKLTELLQGKTVLILRGKYKGRHAKVISYSYSLAHQHMLEIGIINKRFPDQFIDDHGESFVHMGKVSFDLDAMPDKDIGILRL